MKSGLGVFGADSHFKGTKIMLLRKYSHNLQLLYLLCPAVRSYPGDTTSLPCLSDAYLIDKHDTELSEFSDMVSFYCNYLLIKML